VSYERRLFVITSPVKFRSQNSIQIPPAIFPLHSLSQCAEFVT